MHAYKQTLSCSKYIDPGALTCVYIEAPEDFRPKLSSADLRTQNSHLAGYSE